MADSGSAASVAAVGTPVPFLFSESSKLCDLDSEDRLSLNLDFNRANREVTEPAADT